MYYDGKKDFYIKQYGPKILLGVFSVLLIGCGTFIYLSSTKTTSNPTSEKEVVVASQSLKDEKKITTGIPEELNKLNLLEKSGNYVVQSVSTNGLVMIKVGEQELKISLIGIDTSKNTEALSKKINENLQGKEIKLAFDEQKTDKKDNSKIYAYIYINDTFYNATLLEKGEAAIKYEKINRKLLNELTQAQAYAKQNGIGIWAE